FPWIALDTVIPFIASTVMVAGMFFVTLKTSWQLALVAVGVAPVVFVFGRRYRRGLRRGSHEVKALEKSALGIVQEVLGSLRVVKACVREGRGADRLVGRSAAG